MTETNKETSEEAKQSQTTRRALLAAIGIAGAGAAGYGVGTVEAAASGEVGTSTNPYLRAYVDRMVWVGRTSDPSSPDDGTVWYRSDL